MAVKVLIKTEDQNVSFIGQTSKEGLDLIRQCKSINGGGAGVVKHDGSAIVMDQNGDFTEAINKDDYAQAFKDFVNGQ